LIEEKTEISIASPPLSLTLRDREREKFSARQIQSPNTPPCRLRSPVFDNSFPGRKKEISKPHTAARLISFFFPKWLALRARTLGERKREREDQGFEWMVATTFFSQALILWVLYG